MKQQMTTQAPQLEISVYSKDLQTEGSFDGGRITETKPVPFPHEGPLVKNTGPLFYWAWATAEGYGKIGLHPHRDFEIISYALEGEIGHYDTLGNKSRVHAGGAQVMQTGSGVSHEEETVGGRTEFFQIWFEPDLRKTLKQEPTYQSFEAGDFPVREMEGAKIKSILAQGSPVKLDTDVSMQDISIPAGGIFERSISEGRSLALLAVSTGLLFNSSSGVKVELHTRDLAVVHAKTSGAITLKPSGNENFRFIAIEVPAEVDYPLYRNGM